MYRIFKVHKSCCLPIEGGIAVFTHFIEYRLKTEHQKFISQM